MPKHSTQPEVQPTRRQDLLKAVELAEARATLHAMGGNLSQRRRFKELAERLRQYAAEAVSA